MKYAILIESKNFKFAAIERIAQIINPSVDLETFSVGDRGYTKTRLALIGEAVINGQIVEVKSEAGFINENEEIEIIRISGDSIFVAKV